MNRRRIQLAHVIIVVCAYWNIRLFAQPTNDAASTNALQAEMEAATRQVEKIVNQPVTAYRRTDGMRVSRFQGGWFHPGALKPDFSNVDIRKTQETVEYEKSEWVTSDLNPGVVWPGNQLEFNSMTKYFYTNRNVPKKKLTQADMEEVNRLYRIIGRCEHELLHARNQQEVAEARNNPSGTEGADSGEGTETAAPAKRPRLLNAYIGSGAILALVLFLGAYSLFRKK